MATGNSPFEGFPKLNGQNILCGPWSLYIGCSKAQNAVKRPYVTEPVLPTIPKPTSPSVAIDSTCSVPAWAATWYPRKRAAAGRSLATSSSQRRPAPPWTLLLCETFQPIQVLPLYACPPIAKSLSHPKWYADLSRTRMGSSRSRGGTGSSIFALKGPFPILV